MRALAIAIVLPLAAAAQTNGNSAFGEVNLEKLHGVETYKTESGKKERKKEKKAEKKDDKQLARAS